MPDSYDEEVFNKFMHEMGLQDSDAEVAKTLNVDEELIKQLRGTSISDVVKQPPPAVAPKPSSVPSQPNQPAERQRRDFTEEFKKQQQTFEQALTSEPRPEDLETILVHQAGHVDTPAGTSCDPAPEEEIPLESRKQLQALPRALYSNMLSMMTQFMHQFAQQFTDKLVANPAQNRPANAVDVSPHTTPATCERPASRSDPVAIDDQPVSFPTNVNTGLLKEASSLGKFHGTESPEIAEHWIDMACYYQATFACDDDRLKVMLVGMRLRDVAAKWFVGLKHARVPWGSPAAFRAAFLKRFCPQVLHKPHHARELLMSGKVIQRHNQSVQTYHQYFLRIVDQATGMGELDQIAWFLHGLTPALRSMCAVDTMGAPWTSLSALFDFVVGAEMRIKHTSIPQQRTNTPRRYNVHAAQAKSFTQKGNQYQTSQTSGHKRPMEHAKGPSPKRAASWPTKVEDFGPPNERNKKFPHITNAEAFRRFQHNLCCFCGDAGHAARQCRAEAHDNRELRK